MYQVIDKHANSILLYITVPPPPRKALHTQYDAVDHGVAVSNGELTAKCTLCTQAYGWVIEIPTVQQKM